MKRYKVIRIEEPDFGCEGRPDGQPIMDKVWLADETGEEIVVEEEDAKLYQVGIQEGDQVVLAQKKGLCKL